jgi:hypothetical protein
MPIIPVTILVLFTILRYDFLHRLLKRPVVILCRERQYVPPMTEQLLPHASVDLETLRYSHAQTRQHHRDQPAGAGAVHVVEVVAWQELVLVKVLP